MKAFGHEAVRTASPADPAEDLATQSRSLREVTLCCTPGELRVLAAFLTHAAELLEKHPSDFEHAHLRDWWAEWQQNFADVIVMRSAEPE